MPKRLPPLRVTGLKVEGRAGKPADFVQLSDVEWHNVTTFKNKKILEIPITLWTFFFENGEELLVKRVTCLNEKGEQVAGEFEVCLQKATWYDIGRDLDFRGVQELPERARKIVRRAHLRYVRANQEPNRVPSDTAMENPFSESLAATPLFPFEEEEYDMFMSPLFTPEEPVFEECVFPEEEKSEDGRPSKRQNLKRQKTK